MTPGLTTLILMYCFIDNSFYRSINGTLSFTVFVMMQSNVLSNIILSNNVPYLLFIFSAGQLLTGDCSKNIFLWKPHQGNSWNVDQRAFVGHTASVEDIQWSPNESTVGSVHRP